jgi:hypothetical protein
VSRFHMGRARSRGIHDTTSLTYSTCSFMSVATASRVAHSTQRTAQHKHSTAGVTSFSALYSIESKIWLTIVILDYPSPHCTVAGAPGIAAASAVKCGPLWLRVSKRGAAEGQQ